MLDLICVIEFYSVSVIDYCFECVYLDLDIEVFVLYVGYIII